MFLLYHSEGCNICKMVLHECYINDLYTTTCSGMLGHHIKGDARFGQTSVDSGCKDARGIIDAEPGANVIFHSIMHPCAKFWSVSTCFGLLVLITSSISSKMDSF
jgi:hypothetical protein